MGLLDAFTQYLRDALPGGLLNPESAPVANRARYASGLLDPNSQISRDAQGWHKRTQVGLKDQLAGRNTPEAEQAYQAMMMAAGMAPVGMTKSVSNSVNDALEYAGQHRPPMKGSGAPLHDLTGGGNYYPDDIYGPMAAQYYGHFGGGHPMDRQTISLIQQMKGKPNATVTMYRAVPKEPTQQEQLALLEKQMAEWMRRGKVPEGAPTGNSVWYNQAAQQRDAMKEALVGPQQPPQKMTINNGDWVTINKAYAKDHGESALNGQYKILSKKVPARKLFTNGDSIHEFGYDESGRLLPEFAGVSTLGGLLGLGALKYNEQ